MIVESDIHPLFPSTIARVIVDDDFSDFKKRINNLKYESISSQGSDGLLISENRKILNDFPVEKNIFLDYFNQFKMEVLGYHSTEFKITTSWATKSRKKSYGQFHKHCNSVYSGVFYFDDSKVPIEFDCENIIPYQFMLPDPVEWNIHNARVWQFFPKKNMLLFFPSYMRHRIADNDFENDRMSVVFNMFPVGKIGERDSSATIDILD